MVQLHYKPDPVATQPGDEPQLPQRPPTIQRNARQTPGHLQQLGFSRPRAQSHLANVNRDVKVLVIDPDRPPLKPPRSEQPSTKNGNPRQAKLDPPPDLLEPQPAGRIEQGLRLDNHQSADVHRRRERLET